MVKKIINGINEALDIMGYNIAAAYFICSNLGVNNNDGSINWSEVWEEFQSKDWQNHMLKNPFIK